MSSHWQTKLPGVPRSQLPTRHRSRLSVQEWPFFWITYFLPFVLQWVQREQNARACFFEGHTGAHDYALAEEARDQEKTSSACTGFPEKEFSKKGFADLFLLTRDPAD